LRIGSVATMDRFTRGSLVFDVTDSGPPDGGVVVLLHGWPQDRTAWDRVRPPLNDAGLRTLAPDQRGYSAGARPPQKSAYRTGELVRDTLALIDEAGAERVHLVGHDWGGAVAWVLAQRHPQRLSGLTVLSTPHPSAMAWAFRHGDQARRSWYMLAFQVPVLPEVVLRPRMHRLLRRFGLPAEDADRYAGRFRFPGAATGGLNWYRGMAASRSMRRSLGGGRRTRTPEATEARRRSVVTVPTTYVWGSRDPALGRDAAERTARYVGGDYEFIELDAGHWLPETRPEEVSRAILSRALP
jgi:pimeloyl-ACP methyl ester carboxylesterase